MYKDKGGDEQKTRKERDEEGEGDRGTEEVPIRSGKGKRNNRRWRNRKGTARGRGENMYKEEGGDQQGRGTN